MAEAGECPVDDLPEYCIQGSGGVPTGLCMVEDFLARAANPTRDLLLNRYALIAGFMMILQFHLMPVVAYLCEKFNCRVAKKAIRAAFGLTRSSNFARCLGRNIIILNIYYSTVFEDLENKVVHAHQHQPFIESVAFAFFESVIIYRLARRLQEKLKDYSVQDPDWWKNEIICSRFSDFSVSWGFTTVTFVAQFALFSIFVLEMNGDVKTHERCNMNVFHWLAAVLVTNVAGLQESGDSFKKEVWDELWEQRETNDNAEKVREHPVQYWTRLFYAGTINGFCRELLLCLAPVALSVVDRDDLVKDCLAIFFISKIDDIEPKTICKALEDWKAELQADDVREERKNMESNDAKHGLGEELLQKSSKIGFEDRLRQLEEKIRLLGGDGDSSTVGEPSRRHSISSGDVV
jgi:hypothetical protein